MATKAELSNVPGHLTTPFQSGMKTYRQYYWLKFFIMPLYRFQFDLSVRQAGIEQA